jgi:hypothetical protein
MPYLLVRHRVNDFATWKAVFDEQAKTRKASGSKGGYLFRNADNPSEVVIALEWDRVENARRFVASPDLRATMERAGVVDRPDVYFLNEAGRPSA